MISSSDFDREVRTAFAFLAADELPRVVDPAEQSPSFGSNFIVLEGGALRVRVSPKRGQNLIALSPLGPDWFDLDVVMPFVV